MNYGAERVKEYLDRQRRANETIDWLRVCWANAKHPCGPNGARDIDQLRAALTNFRSPLIDGALINKAAVSGGSSHGDGWAAELTDYRSLASEWLLTTSAKTFLGRLQFRRIPFNKRVLNTEAPDATFVAQGVGIPVMSLNLDDSSVLDRTKVATIAILTNESVESWGPGTRENLDAVLTRSVVRGMDMAALDPDRAAVAGERPASLLNGIAPIAALASSAAGVLTQIKSMLQVLVDGGSDLESALFALHPKEALTLSTLITTEGVRAFPDLGASGGSILGIPAVTSVGATRTGSPSERVLALVDGSRIAVADDGEISINASRLSDVQMDDSPTNRSSATATGSTMVSMFQTDSTAIKLVRTINWTRLDDSAVAWLTVAA